MLRGRGHRVPLLPGAGFEGYHEMRIALAQANTTGALINQRVPEPDADTATLCEHASALLMTTINGTRNALSP